MKQKVRKPAKTRTGEGNLIKTPDLCDKCARQFECKSRIDRVNTDCVSPTKCSMYYYWGCKCSEIQKNTPCPYFEALEED